MQTAAVIVDTHLRVDVNDIGQEASIQALREVTVLNEERVEKQIKGIGGWWTLPEHFELGSLDGDTLVLPRGYALQLKMLLREHDMRVRWIDRRKYSKGAPLGKDEFSYREHQPEAVRQIRRHQQLIYKAPTGSGKTVTCIGALWELSPQKSLILVDRINLVDQWIDRIVTHLGYSREKIGRIGDGKWSEGRITVATVQSLHRRRHDLQDSGWFDMWDFVCLDECHHVTAQTFLELMQLFPARYRLGMSATPDKTGVFELALNTLGEVAYETTQEELRELGILVEPHIEVVPTNFKFKYWSDHKANKKGDCSKPGCKNPEPYHKHRNNYHQLKQALVEDVDRNITIVNKLIENEDNVQLVITDQTSHIAELEREVIAALIGRPVHVLTGKQSGKKRQEIISEIENSGDPCIILSTIAGEALDIPIIDRVHLVWPTRNPRKTEQNVGRGTRKHDSKGDTVIYDYVDHRVPVLAGQFRTRRWKCYEPLGFKVQSPLSDEADETPQRKKGLTMLGAGR